MTAEKKRDRRGGREQDRHRASSACRNVKERFREHQTHVEVSKKGQRKIGTVGGEGRD